MARSATPTPTQQRVLDYILRVTGETGAPPTEREITAHFRWKSKYAAQRHIKYLIQKGLLKRRPGVARGLSVPSAVVRRQGLRGIPLLGQIPAGRPLDAIENLEGTIGIDPALLPEADVFALRVQGESMTGAGIHHGDLLFVKQTPTARDGDIVVAMIDGETTLKRFFLRDGRVVLHPENPAFKDIEVGENADFSLAGVVVGTFRRYGP